MNDFLKALLLLALLIFAPCALADTTLTNGNTVGQTTVTLTLDPSLDSYAVVIPSSVTIDPDTRKGTGRVTIKGGDAWNVKYGASLTVYFAESKNSLKLLNTRDSGKKIGYQLRSASGSTINPGGEILSWRRYDADGKENPGVEKDISAWIEFRAENTIPAAGTYQDIVTFNVVFN